MEQTSEPTNRPRRGFAAMEPEKQKQIARQGGRAAHEQGVAHKWNTEEAREAGKKGGQARKSEDKRMRF